MPGCQLVDSPIILEALIEGFWVCRIYVDGGSSSEVMNNQQGQGRKSRKTWGPNGIIHPSPVSSKKYTQAGKKDKVEDESLEKSSGSKPPEKVTWNSPLRFRTRAQNIPSHRAESAKEAEHSFGQKKSSERRNLNKACPKDLYPLPEFDWKIKSLMGFKYKCFLDAYKGYHQIQMAKKDKEKTEFHTDEGVFCYTKMPFGLKNVGETYQRLFNTIFKGQMGRNLEAYVDDMVIKSKTELEMMKDVEETLLTLKKTTEAEEAFQAMKKLIAELPTLTTPKKEEELMVYLSAANKAVSVVLLVERDGRQTLSITWLRRYFQCHTISVITDKPIRQILNNREATGRLAKWGVELKAYDIKYSPRSEIKGQVLADFLADAMTEDNPTQVKTDRPDDTLAERESMEEQEDAKTKAPENLRAEIDIWKLYTDGASNEHGSGAGLILIDLEGAEYSYALQLNFANSNNDAEYEALLAGLRIATKMKVKKMHEFVDSKLVANQVEGSYEVKAWPFRKWGMDIVGPLPEAPGKIKYLIVAIDYFTKWFGVPATIITNNGTHLINDPFKSWAEGLRIKLVSTLVYHPQANRAVEQANRSIMQGIKTRLNLNLLEERRKIATIREAIRKRQMEKYYNQRVHYKQFKVGEFVLQKNKLSKVENTGKLGPKWEGPYEVVETYGMGAYKLRSIDGAEIPRTWHFSIYHLEEIHMTWAHLEKKRTRLRTNTKTLEDLCSQSLETASPTLHDAVTTHLVMASQHFMTASACTDSAAV
ncbi:reverse transcriptase domain-containing protein [Tanacetum coccineum]